MSKKRNRAKLNKAKTSREYQHIQMFNDYCPICMKRSGSWYYDCSPKDMRVKHRHGNGKAIYSWNYRRYKTWKHNRKTQWKS